MSINSSIKVFVVEDDVLFSALVKERLQLEGDFEVSTFEAGEELWAHMHLHPDIIVLDYNLPGKDGIELLKEIQQHSPSIECIILSGQKEVEVVVKAYKYGASHYLIKNENSIVELLHCIAQAKRSILLEREIEELREKVVTVNSYENIIGESDAMKKVFTLMKKVENVQIPILITGESGTGKELVAQALHYHSDQKKGPFIAVNVAAIPEDLVESELFGHEKGAFTGADSSRTGKFEQANDGTIFLDEIGELDINIQTKFLRVLQERKVSRLGSSKEVDLIIRVLAATNKNLWEEVKKGNFREDLYFRLQGFLIHLPPLRERGHDIIILAKHFMQKFCEKQKIAAKLCHGDAIKAMLEYSWPGNVRELKSMVERAVLISDKERIMPDDLVFLEEKTKQ